MIVCHLSALMRVGYLILYVQIRIENAWKHFNAHFVRMRFSTHPTDHIKHTNLSRITTLFYI